MADNVIQSFLVSLGYTVKANEERNFVDSLGKAKVAAAAFAASLAGLVAMIAKVAEGYEQLYYASQRVGASVQNIQAFSYALSQVGGSAAGASAALESIGNFLRSGPGAESFMQRLGIQTRDANGGLRDTTEQLQDFFRVAKTMPYYRARAYAQVLGIDDRTLQAGMRGLGDFGAQLKAMYRAAGVDSQAAAAGSAKFMQQLRGLGAALQVLRDKVAISLERGVGGMIERLQRMLVANFGRISAAIVAVSKFIIALGWDMMQLVGRAADIIDRLVDWFNGLDRSTRQWTAGIALLLAGWYLLNRGFLATPLGRIVAIGVAIASLVDDYEHWKSGGKSLIDWSAWKPGIDAATDAIGKFETLLSDFWPKVKPYLLPMIDFFKHEFTDAFKTTGKVLSDWFTALDAAIHGRWGAAGAALRTMLADTEASGREGQSAAGGLAKSLGINGTGGLLDHSAADNALGLNGRGVSSMTRGWRWLTGQTSRAEASGYDILKGLGIDRTHAVAMLGNFEQESSLDPSAKNGNHFGIEQWSADRADTIKAQTGIDVRTAGYADQLKAAVWEITAGSQRKNAREFFKAGSLKDATGRFATDIERSGESPGMKGFDNRIANSINADNRLRFADSGSASKGSTPHINAPMNTTIHVTGTGHPEQVAKSVAAKQAAVSASLVRNMTPLAY